MQAWQSAIQLLQLHLLELDPARKQPAASTSAELLSRACSNQDQLQRINLSSTAVAQMLQAEVPLRVVTACCKVLQHGSSASSSTTAAPAYHAASEQDLAASTWRIYCLELPYLLLTALMKLGLLRAGHPITLPPAALIGQQFQQSGVLDLLPQLLQGTADQLQAAAAAGVSAAVSSSDTGSAASSSTVSYAQQGNSKQGTAARLPKLTQQDWLARPDLLLLRGASCLLFIYTTLSYCWPLGKFAVELVPACAPAVLQLASITLQHASQLLDQHQMDTFSHTVVYELWVNADEAVRLALTPDADTTYAKDSSRSLLDSSGTQQYYSVLFDSPHTGQCMAVLLASAAYTALLLQLPHLPDLSVSSSSCSGSGGSSKSSGGSSSSGGSTRVKPTRKLQALQCADPSKAWQFACEQHKLLPPTHQGLLRHAGCSSRVVLFAATCMAAKWNSTVPSQPSVGLRGIHRLGALSNAFAIRCERMWRKLQQQEQQQQRQQQQQRHNIIQEQRQEQLLLCLVPGVLLYWAALQPPTVPPGVPINVQSAVYSSRSAVSAAMQLAGSIGIYPLTVQPTSSHRLVCGFIPASVRETVLTDVLTLATRIGAGYLASLGAERSDNTGGTNTSGGSNSSTGINSSGSSSDSTTGANSSGSSTRAASSSSASSAVVQATGGTGGTAAMPVGEEVKTNPVNAHDMAHHLVLLLAMLAENTDFSAAGATSDVGAVQVLSMPKAQLAALSAAAAAEAQQAPLSAAAAAEAQLAALSAAAAEARLAARSAAAAAEAQLAPLSAAVWQQHTLAVAKLLEGKVRHNAVFIYMLRCLIGDTDPGPIAAGAKAAGPGSPEQQQLISLLCSTLKAPGGDQADLQVHKCMCILGAATAALCGSVAAAAATSNTLAVAAVPWLAVMGRCLLLLAALLPEVCTPPAESQPTLCVQSEGPAGTSVARDLLTLIKDMQQVTKALQGLLCDDGPASLTAQLTAAGYISWAAIPAQLQPLADAAEALGMPDGSAPSQDQVSTAAQLMTTFGLSLNTLAFPTACNNPHCSNLSGPSELLLVSGRSNMCAGCLVARYCSRDCQRQHWKQHKPVCKALAAAAAKTADSAAATAKTDDT